MTALTALVLAGVLAYLGLVGMVWWKETHVPPMDDYEAIIVLGCQVKADGSLSRQLQWRLDTAYDAWLAHPCTVIVTGSSAIAFLQRKAIFCGNAAVIALS